MSASTNYALIMSVPAMRVSACVHICVGGILKKAESLWIPNDNLCTQILLANVVVLKTIMHPIVKNKTQNKSSQISFPLVPLHEVLWLSQLV